MHKRRTALTSLAFGALLLVGAAACSSSADVEVVAETSPTPAVSSEVQAPIAEPTVAAATVEQAPVTESEDDAPDESATTADETSGSGTVEIAFDDGRTWTLTTRKCELQPESPFGVFFMEGANDAGADLGVIETWPLSGDRSNGTAFIATFLDENGDPYVLDAAEVQQVGDSLTFTTGIYDGAFATETTLSGTFTCTP